MKKSIKILTKIMVIMLAMLILFSTLAKVNSQSNPNFEIDPFESGNSVKTDVDDLVNNTATTVVAVLRIVSVAIAMVVLLTIAMKYMISSAGDRADIKKHAVAYVTGTVILFAATQIIAVLIDVASNFSSSGTEEG